MYEIEISTILLKDRQYWTYIRNSNHSLVVTTYSDPSGSGAGLLVRNSALILEGILIIFGLIGLLAQGFSHL